MHLLVRETVTPDDAEQAIDLDHGVADLVFLSFSDSDLGVVASAWEMMPAPPSLRLANLSRLRHPMAIDLYLEKTLSNARCIIIRLLGGLDYWRYGAEETAALCKARGIPLAIVPGDERLDFRLAALSTVNELNQRNLTAYFRYGGLANVMEALTCAAGLGGLSSAAPPSARACSDERCLSPG